MNPNSKKAPRGRPKTLDRGHILDVAMQSCWGEGVDGISVNEICRRAKVSKPGLYREFGNEDGLMRAVLVHYQQQVMTPMEQMLTADAPFRETLDKFVESVMADSDDPDAPKGCLLVNMLEARDRLGETTQEQLDRIWKQHLSVYRDWVESAKARGEFTADIPTALAAAYMASQLRNAASQLGHGEKTETVGAILALAFSVLV